jgi:exo-beta-1,3-glucanase (GH17 family)
MFLNMVEQNAEKENIGIMVVPSYDYYDNDSVPEATDPWFKNTVRNVKQTNKTRSKSLH